MLLPWAPQMLETQEQVWDFLWLAQVLVLDSQFKEHSMFLNSLVRVLIQVPGTLLQPTEDPIRELGLWSQTWHQICAPPLVAHPVSSWSLTCLSPPHCSDLRVSTLDPPSFLCSLKTLCSFPFWGPLYLHRMFFPHIASGLDPFFQALPSSNISSLVSLPGSSYPMFTSWFPY